MVGAVAIRLKDPVFESQTKNKLGNTEIRSDLVNQVREELLHFFNRNKEVAEKIIAKVAGHAAVAQGIAGGEEAGARTGQGHHHPHSAAQGLQGAFRQGEGQGQGLDGVHHRRAVRRRFNRELPRREHAGDFRAQGQAAQRLGPQARHRLQERRDVQPDAQPGHRGQPRGPALREGDPRHRRRRGRPAHPQPADHLFLPVLRPTGA